MTVLMKARRSFPYAGKRLKAGDEFRATGESDARVLAAIGHAERVTVVAPAYSTRMMTAASSLPPVPMKLAAQYVIKVDGANVALDDMEAEPLHELAKRLGVKVHHLAGARKVRAALVDAQAGQ
jgi:hypothetical protein